MYSARSWMSFGSHWRALAGLGLLVCLVGCSRGAASDEEGAKVETVAEVTVTKIERGPISSALNVNGTVNAPPNRDVRVSSLVAGRIAEIRVAEGDMVTKDQVLAKIDDRPYRDQLQQADAAAQQARAQQENARLALEREETLFGGGISARKEVEEARTQQKVSEAAVRQAEAAVALARLQLARTEVAAPLDGTVVKRLMSAGEAVDGTAAQPIVQVANLSSVELFANVPANYLGRIHVGQKLEISSDAFPDAQFAGRVVAISPAVDPATNIGLVRIEIANAGAKLRYGMYLSALVPLETHENALVVPRQAVYRDEAGKTLVYKVEGGSVHEIPVTLGIETPDRVELSGQVQPGDTVVLGGGYGLPDGAKVKVHL
ncbi:MAG TPA: efflux RND transporter periplasmic adaptor subunit [Candidatus Binatia bacterium]|nr:efflux RND transporter periplasmic adaptor subunit [Candidatus Binatia bacterium]